MRAFVLVLLLALTGCAEFQAVFAERAAFAADEQLKISRYGVCHTTVSAADRAYGIISNPASANAVLYQGFCTGVVSPVVPLASPSQDGAAVGGALPLGYAQMCEREPEHPLCRQ